MAVILDVQPRLDPEAAELLAAEIRVLAKQAVLAGVGDAIRELQAR